jgi:hypothetical protein
MDARTAENITRVYNALPADRRTLLDLGLSRNVVDNSLRRLRQQRCIRAVEVITRRGLEKRYEPLQAPAAEEAPVDITPEQLTAAVDRAGVELRELELRRGTCRWIVRDFVPVAGAQP